MVSIIFISILILVGFIVLIFHTIKVSKEKREEFNKWKKELEVRYGETTIVIQNDIYEDKHNCILVFDCRKIIIINEIIYVYNEILDFNINDQKSYKTSTSTGSMLGRALVGGVLTGGVGALIGGATAEKNTTVSDEEYKVNIFVKRMATPLITVTTKYLPVVNKISAVLRNIIDSNNKTENMNKN